MARQPKTKKKSSKSSIVSKLRLNLSLQTKLTVTMISLALIPVIAVTAIVVLSSRTAIVDLVDTTVKDQAKRLAIATEEALRQVKNELHGLTVNPSIEQLVVVRPTNIVRDLGLEGKSAAEMEQIMDGKRNLEANSRTQTFLETTVLESEAFAELIVTNLDGMVVGATGRPDRFIHLEETWFQEALEHGSYLSSIQILPGHDNPGVIVSEVIKRSSTGNPAGIIRGLIPLQYLSASLIEAIDKIEQGELQLLIDDGVVVSVTNRSGEPSLEVFLGETSPKSILLQDQVTNGYGRDSLEQDAIVGASHLATVNWEVRIAQPTRYSLAVIDRLVNTGYLGVALTILLVGGMTLLLSRGMVGPIKELTEHAKGVTTGHLRQYRPKRQSNDEVGALTEAFNAMTSHLARLLHRIETAGTALATSSQEISAGMEEMAAGAQNQIEDIQSGTEQVEEMNRGMQNIDERATRALKLSQVASEASSKGESQASAAVRGMDAIKLSVDDLGEQTEQIARILTFIRDIAEQTNLLALNAAIEAARAGEQGRSFAVVAQEVRELAERSQSATAEISQVLGRIQNETVRSIQSVEDGRRQVLEMQKALHSITEAAEATEALVEAIAEESIRQTGRTREAVALFENISQITEQTAAGTEETAASAQNLAAMALELQNMLKRFRQ